MSKVFRAAGDGCQVRGRWTQADGSPAAGQPVIFTPQRGGVWRGRVIGRQAVKVTTEADGRFCIALAPSRLVGLYEVAMANVKLVVDVPDAAEAELTLIVAR